MADAKEKAQALAVQNKADETALVAKFGGMMDSEGDIEASDLLLSKLLGMQGQSKLVQEEKAKLGEIRDSLSGSLIADKEKSVDVIFFNPFKTWAVFEKAGGTEKYKAIVPYTPENSSWERETDKEVRYKTQNYYVLLASEIEKGEYIPRAISLRSTNYQCGRKIESKRAFLKKFGQALPFQVFGLATVKRQNEKGSWFVFDVTETRKSTDKELSAVKDWMDIISKSQVKVDDSDFQTEAEGVEDTGEY